MHDLDERRLARPLPDRAGGAHDRPYLHLVDLRELQPEAAAARAEHRVRLVQLADAVAHRLGGRLLERRQELVERRVEEADGHGQPGHGLEDSLEVALLQRQEPVERAAALLLVAREDHLADDREPLVGHEHVLGAAEPDPLRAELARLRRILGRVRVGPHAQASEIVGPTEDRAEVLVDRRRDERHLADDDSPGAAVDGQDVARAQLVLSDLDGPRCHVDRELLAARDARLPHAARDDRSVGGHAAVRGEHPRARG